jgi:Tol biopolymer transport system component
LVLSKGSPSGTPAGLRIRLADRDELTFGPDPVGDIRSIFHFVFSDDSQLLAYTRVSIGASDLYVTDLDSGQTSHIFQLEGGDYSSQPVFNSSGTRILFTSFGQSEGGIAGQRLFSSPVVGGDPMELLSPSVEILPAYGFKFVPDRSSVVFRARADLLPAFSLFSLPTDGSIESPIQLSPLFDANDDVRGDFSISKDGQHVIFRSDFVIDGSSQLYRVPIAGGTPLKLNPDPVPGGDVDAFLQTPDGQGIVYRSDHARNGIDQLYEVPFAGGASTQLTSSTRQRTDAITGFQLSPTGNHVVYRAMQGRVGSYELFATSTTGEIPIRLNLPLVVSGDVGKKYQITPDGTRVVYIADQDTNTADELYSVSIGGGAVTKLNTPLQSNRDVNDFKLVPGGSRLVYRADQDVNRQRDLYAVDLDGGNRTKLSPVMIADGDVEADYQISPDGRLVAFRADAFSNGRRVVLLADLAPELAPAPRAVLFSANDHLLGFDPLSSHVLYRIGGASGLLAAVPAGGDPSFWIAGRQVSVAHGFDLAGEQVIYHYQAGDTHQIVRSPIAPGLTRTPIREDFSPDGEFLAHRSLGLVTSLSGGSLRTSGLGGEEIEFHSDRVSQFAMNADTQQLVFVNVDDSRLYADQIGKETEALSIASEFEVPPGSMISVSPDSERIAVMFSDGDGRRRLSVIPVSGGLPIRLTPSLPEGASGVKSFEFTSDSQQIVYLADLERPGLIELFATIPGVIGRESFADWQHYHQMIESDLDSDRDGDGVVEAMEFALLLDPNVPDPHGLPRYSIAVDGSATFEFTRSLRRTSVRYSVQTTEDFTNWESVAESVDGSQTGALTDGLDVTENWSEGDDRALVSVEFLRAEENGRLYVRLSVEIDSH